MLPAVPSRRPQPRVPAGLSVAAQAVVRLACSAMATRFELVLVGDDEIRLRAAGEAALAEVQRCDEQLSLFRRDSVITHINRQAATGWVPVDTDTFELLAVCAEVHRSSGGAFDPTVAPLMRALGLHGDGSSAEMAQDLQSARDAVGMAGVELDADRRAVRLSRGMALDCGAVGKGHALDLAAEVLREAGVGCALVHGGTSTVMALGAPPGQQAWRVGLGPGDGGPVARLRDGALSVSASHGRGIEHAGERIGHVLDPLAGVPARGLAGAAVICGSALLADAWSTALLAGAEAGKSSLPPGASALAADGEVDSLQWRPLCVDRSGPSGFADPELSS